MLPSKGPAKNAQVVVQIQGVEEQINLAPRFAIEPPKLLTQRPAVISEDANQLGNFTLEFAAIDNPPNLGNPHEIPIEWGPAFLNDLARFNQWNAKLKGLDAENAHLQAKLARGNITSPLRIKEQIRLKHNRRAGIKQEVDHWAARMGYSAVVSTQAPILAMENLASLRDARKTGGAGKNSELYGKTSDADCRKDTSMGESSAISLGDKIGGSEKFFQESFRIRWDLFRKDNAKW